MRFMLLLLSGLCLMLASSCSDDSTNPPAPDLKVVADTTAKPDVAKPDTQSKPDQGGDTLPHFDFTVPKCPFEMDVSTKLPCTCGSTLLYDLKVQYPDCKTPMVVKCCPLDSKPKCE